ncbi:MAG: YraN family protein [Oscillospiraceae bacterium]|nr:YraN family protein [Oscillospiraceae bacterium]
MYYNQQTGRLGEEEAVKYLTENGYEIIQRNFSCNFGEIDIIAKDVRKDELIFVEVKTRSNQQYGTPGDGVNHYKKKHIFKTAEFFVYINKLENEFMRIDVVEVYIKDDNIFSINHIKQAFD